MVSKYSNTVRQEDGKIKKEVGTEIAKVLEGQAGFERLGTESINIIQSVILNGWGYRVYHKILNLAPAAKYYLEFTAPTDKLVSLVHRDIYTNKESVNYKVYKTYTGVVEGANVLIRNLREDTANTNVSACTLKVVTGVTPTATEASIHTDIDIYGQADVGNRASGKLDEANVFNVFGDGQKRLLEFTNNSAAAVNITFEAIWGEYPTSLVRPPIII